jgi:hypothetical protein
MPKVDDQQPPPGGSIAMETTGERRRAATIPQNQFMLIFNATVAGTKTQATSLYTKTVSYARGN